MVTSVNRTSVSIASRLFSVVDENCISKRKETSSLVSLVIEILPKIQDFGSILNADTLEKKISVVHSLTIKHHGENPNSANRVRRCIPVSLLDRSVRVADRIAVQTLHGKAPNRLQILIIRIHEIVTGAIFSLFGLTKGRRSAILQRMVEARKIIEILKNGSSVNRNAILNNKDQLQIGQKLKEDLKRMSRFVGKNKTTYSSPTYENLAFIAKDIRHLIKEILFTLSAAEVQECIYEKVKDKNSSLEDMEKLINSHYSASDVQLFVLAQLAVISRKEIPSKAISATSVPRVQLRILRNSVDLLQKKLRKDRNSLSTHDKKVLYRITKDDDKVWPLVQKSCPTGTPIFYARDPNFFQKCISKICELVKKVFFSFSNKQKDTVVPTVKKEMPQTIQRTISLDKITTSHGEYTWFELIKRLKKNFSIVESGLGRTGEETRPIIQYKNLYLVSLCNFIKEIKKTFEIEVKEHFYSKLLEQHSRPLVREYRDLVNSIADMYHSSKMELFVLAQLAVIAKREALGGDNEHEKEKGDNFAAFTMVCLCEKVGEQRETLSQEDIEILYEITEEADFFFISQLKKPEKKILGFSSEKAFLLP